jgi:ABC-2 type transport system permease protein
MELKKQRANMGAAELVIILLIILAVNYLGYKFFVRVDMTENKQYTISKATKNVLAKLQDPVTAEFFLSSDLPPQLITVRNEVKDKLAEYAAFSGGKFKLRYIDPGTDTAKKETATSKGVNEIKVQVVEHDQATSKNVFFGMALSYADKTEAIPVVDPSNIEYDLTSKLVKMTMAKKPKVGIFEGPMTFNQQQPPAFNQVQNLLGGPEGMYDVVKINPQTDKVLPEDLDGLIVLGAFNMSEAMKYGMDQLLMKGGKVLVAIDPMMRAGNQGGLDQAYPSLPTLEDQLQVYGVRFDKQLIVDELCANAPFSQGMFTLLQPYPLWPEIGPAGLNKEVAAVGKLEKLTLPWCCPLNEVAVPGVKFSWLAKTSDKSFSINSPFSLMPDQNWRFLKTSSPSKGPYNVIVMTEGALPTAFAGGPPQLPPPAAGEDPALQPAPFNPAGQVKVAGKDARLIVMSSAMGLSDDFFQIAPENGMFLNNAADMLLLGDDLLGIRSAPTAQRPLKALSDGLKLVFRWLNVLGVPVLLVLFGFMLWFMKGKRRHAIQARFAE